jgi:hypothetical protein
MLVVVGTPVAFATTGLLHLVAWPGGSEIETSTRLRDYATLWTVVQALRHQASMAPSQSYGLMTLPPDATVQQQAQPVVAEVAKPCPTRLTF